MAGPLYLKASSINGTEVIAEALNRVPCISRNISSIGWSLVIDQVASVSFHEDMLAFAIADSYEEGRQMLLAFATLLDRHSDDIVGLDECKLQAWVVGERVGVPIRHLCFRWSRTRATNPRVVWLSGPHSARQRPP
ncbi:hypothetical protein B1810_12455 [Panacagrimonas perspica]|uniref:hypothetical protein n=1 Tax=Panacagrimonas perspica TaxID=381431 RepID=UPI0010A0A3F0|nr:hypothetical protein [Panacagrimonas perspica]THD02732.1 hypothetical protein B1810_12455 [Panacagrimonas perspica]